MKSGLLGRHGPLPLPLARPVHEKKYKWKFLSAKWKCIEVANWHEAVHEPQTGNCRMSYSPVTRWKEIDECFQLKRFYWEHSFCVMDICKVIDGQLIDHEFRVIPCNLKKWEMFEKTLLPQRSALDLYNCTQNYVTPWTFFQIGSYNNSCKIEIQNKREAGLNSFETIWPGVW